MVRCKNLNNDSKPQGGLRMHESGGWLKTYIDQELKRQIRKSYTSGTKKADSKSYIPSTKKADPKIIYTRHLKRHTGHNHFLILFIQSGLR
jgi:hypothetical protein